MKRCEGILKAYYLVKEASLVRLHTACKYLALWKRQNSRIVKDQWLSGVSREGEREKEAEHRGFLGQRNCSV